jgi:hypothetical protein
LRRFGGVSCRRRKGRWRRSDGAFYRRGAEKKRRALIGIEEGEKILRWKRSGVIFGLRLKTTSCWRVGSVCQRGEKRKTVPVRERR